MNKKNIIGVICILVVIGAVLIINLCDKKGEINDEIKDVNRSTTIIYDKEGNIVSKLSNQREIIEVIENTTIQGIVELNHNGYIYIFNGQHFGEYGFEMEEYSRANIDNRNQKCIDYYTLEEYDPNYIEEGDIIICTGDLKKYSTGDNDFDTKDNAVIVLKSKDYNKIKNETIKNTKTEVITVGEYYDTTGEIYVKYDILDKEHKLPFVLKFNITEDTQVKGNLAKGKKLKIQYKDLNVPVDELEIKTIEVIEK